MTLKQDQIDAIRFMYDTTACSMERTARHFRVSVATANKYISDRSIKPSPPCSEAARWSGPPNSAENRGP